MNRRGCSATALPRGTKGALFTLIMSKTGVKLGIVRGSELPDPGHLMTGTGQVHRHVQLRSVDDIKRPGLDQLLKAAVAAWHERNSAQAQAGKRRVTAAGRL